MKGLFVRLRSKWADKASFHTRELIRGSAAALAVKVLAAAMTFGFNVAIARLLGAGGAGVFFLALTITIIAATIGRVGMEHALVRFIAGCMAVDESGQALGVYRKAMKYSLFVASGIFLLVFFLAPLLSEGVFGKSELEPQLEVLAFAIPPLALLTLHSYALQGMKRTAASISVFSLIVPSLALPATMLILPLAGAPEVAAALGYVVSTVLTLYVGRALWKNATMSLGATGVEFPTRELLNSAFPLFGVTIMTMVTLWSPMLFLGVWESSENVGIYNAASRTAMLTSFVLIAVSAISSPKFAALFRQGDMASLQGLVKTSTRIMILSAAPALLLFTFAPQFILSFFGSEFVKGETILIVLAVGQFVNVSSGLAFQLLNMTGNEVLVRNILVFCALLALLLGPLLTAEFGVEGAAVAAAIVLASQNLIAVILVKRRLGIRML